MEGMVASQGQMAREILIKGLSLYKGLPFMTALYKTHQGCPVN
jgi:hypothetical protein